MISEEDFERAIENFEKEHGNLELYAQVRLSYVDTTGGRAGCRILPQTPNPHQEQIISYLFSHPIIHAYLTRNAHQVLFVSNNPVLNSQEARLYLVVPR